MGEPIGPERIIRLPHSGLSPRPGPSPQGEGAGIYPVETPPIPLALSVLEDAKAGDLLGLLGAFSRRWQEVVGYLAEEAARPENKRMLTNMAATYAFFKSLDPESTQAATKGFALGLATARGEVQRSKKIGFWGLLRSLRDPDLNRGLRGFLAFLRGWGQSAHQEGPPAQPAPPEPPPPSTPK